MIFALYYLLMLWTIFPVCFKLVFVCVLKGDWSVYPHLNSVQRIFFAISVIIPILSYDSRHSNTQESLDQYQLAL